jgi:hypothetical protein
MSSQNSWPARPFSAKRGAWRVEPAAGAAAGDGDARAGDDEVVRVAGLLDRDLGAGRDAHDQLVAVGAVAQRALAVASAVGLVMGLALERLQVAVGVVAEQHDVAAVPAVAPVRAALGNVRLATERHAAVAAAARLDVDARLVVQHVVAPKVALRTWILSS